jgi:hypothetical protein
MKKKLLQFPALIVLLLTIAIFSNFNGLISLLDTYNSNPPNNPNSSKVLVVWKTGMGEHEFINRLNIAAENMGIELRVYQERVTWYEPLFRSVLLNRIRHTFKPDFAIHFDRSPVASPNIPSYLLIFNELEPFIDMDKKNDNLSQFQGYFYCANDISLLKEYIETKGRRFNAIPLYPSCQKVDFSSSPANSDDRTLFYSKRRPELHTDVLLNLEKEGYLSVYGKESSWPPLQSSYKGFLPSDGISLLRTMHHHGMTLIFHSPGHLKTGAPTGRIFEAAAAHTLIITDRHPFIENVFGNNVLYIDQTANSQPIYHQINSHIQWAKSHPDEAKKLADASHEIFLNNFTLEQQWDRIIKFHKSLQLEPVSRSSMESY